MKNMWKCIEKIMSFVVFKIFRLRISESIWEKWCQFVKFGLVGISNTIIYYIVYVILLFFHVSYLLASIIAYIVSIFNAYYWNSGFVFKNTLNPRKSRCWIFFKTFLSYSGTGLILNNILLILWIDYLGINEIYAPILNLIITIPLNYILNKFWAYKR